MTRSDLADVDVDLVHETDVAYLVAVGEWKVWVPKSRCEYDDGTLTAPKWLLLEKGLI